MLWVGSGSLEHLAGYSILNFKLDIVQCKVCTVHGTLYTVNYTVYNLLISVYSLNFRVVFTKQFICCPCQGGDLLSK